MESDDSAQVEQASDTTEQGEGEERGIEVTAQAASTFKVLGEFDASDGAGVLGKNTASGGTPIGVEGVVPQNADGFGLSTPDDARIEGAIDTATTDFVVRSGVTSNDQAGNVVMGHEANEVTNGAGSATIGGGGYNSDSLSNQNKAHSHYATIGGGLENEAGDPSDVTDGASATVAGGNTNEATGGNSAIGGGIQNEVSGEAGCIPGGEANLASGQCSFAAGRGAEARHGGAFVWADNTDDAGTEVPFGSNIASGSVGGENSFNVRATGGARFVTETDSNGKILAGVEVPAGSGSWSSLSHAEAKSNVSPVEPKGVLEDVEDISISEWSYDAQDGVRHMGPMAGEFADAFGLGGDERRIANVDADGVALAAIQGLAARLEDERARLDEQNRQLREELAAKSERLSALEERLTALEASVDGTEGADASTGTAADD